MLISNDKTEPETRLKDTPASSATPSSIVATRWIRRLAVLQFILLTLAIGWLGNALIHCPTANEFDTQSTYPGVIELKDSLIQDLRSKPAVVTFAPEDLPMEDDGQATDYSFIRMLVEWGEDDRNDPAEMQQLSQRIITEYQRVFTEYTLDLKWLFGSALAAIFSTLFLFCVPRLSFAVLTLALSCSITPVVSELTIGKDLSDMFVYSVPFLVLSLTMFVLAFVKFWSEKFQREPSTEDAWIQIEIGLVALAAGLGLTAYEMTRASQLSYKTTQGLGASIATGLWCLIAGGSDLLKKRSCNKSSQQEGQASVD